MRFEMVDVFANTPFSGNPVAVVLDADDVDPALFPAITRWFNLSETTFLLRPTNQQADYRARIFTLEREMPFAGHPTLGSCRAWLSCGGKPRKDGEIIQECGAGLVEIRGEDSPSHQLAFKAPPLIKSGEVAEEKLQEIVRTLRIDRSAIVAASWADNGPGWIALMLESAEAVLAVKPERTSERRLDVGLVGPHAEGHELAYELRAFFTDQHGALLEDPVTGSLNASVAQWLRAQGLVADGYSAGQGQKIGRDGRIRVVFRGDETWVGGKAVTMFSGTAKELSA